MKIEEIKKSYLNLNHHSHFNQKNEVKEKKTKDNIISFQNLLDNEIEKLRH